jgi:hypothetical protein
MHMYIHAFMHMHVHVHIHGYILNIEKIHIYIDT